MRQYYSNITPVFPDPVLYSPDFSYMDKMLQRKEQQYNSGFSKLANQWAYISRPVTNPENAKLRDAFLKQAKENLKDLSTLDLSEYQNVELAMNVFAPYQNNQELIGDQELTQFFNEQETIAEGYRTTEGGKYFNEDNLNDIRLQRSLFAQAKPTDWKNFYNNKRPYSPYYNTQDEYTKLMESFKPSSVTTINKNGFYITTITDKSWYKEDIQRYLNGMLSDKAKDQWAIEARVRLNSDPDGVKKLYLEQSKERLPAIDKELHRIDVELIKAKTQEEKDALLKNKDYFNNLKKELSDNVSKIEKGDQNFIRQNLETFSRSVYINGVIDKIATSNQHKDIAQKLDFDQAALTVYQQQQQNWRTKYSEDAQTYRTKLTLAARSSGDDEDGEGGKGLTPPVIVSAGTQGDEDKPLTHYQLQQKANQQDKLVEKKHQELSAFIKSSNNVKGELTQETFEKWLAANPNNDMTREYLQAKHDADSYRNMANQRKADAEKYAKEKIGEENYNKMLEWKKQANIEKTKIAGQTAGEINGVMGFGAQGDYGGNKLIRDGNGNWVIVDNAGKVISNKGKYYFEKNNGVSAYDMDQKLARGMGGVAASQKTGINGFQYETAYNQYYNEYLSKEIKLPINDKGFSYVKGSKGFNKRQNTISNLAGLESDDVVNVIAVPTPKGLNISFKVKETKDNPMTQERFDEITRNIKTRIGNENIQFSKYNPTTKLITIRNAPRLEAFRNDDIYGEINPAFHTQITEITSWRGPELGASRKIPLAVQDAGGKNRIFNMQKVTGSSPDNDMYMLLNPLDGSNLFQSQTFYNIIPPYKAMAHLLNNTSEDVDFILQTYANKNKK